MVTKEWGLFICDQDCNVESPTHAICETPSFQGLDFLGSRRRRATADEAALASLSYGFIMDDVRGLLNLTELLGESEVFIVYPDPSFVMFEDGTKKFFQEKNDDLLISVRFLIRCLFL